MCACRRPCRRRWRSLLRLRSGGVCGGGVQRHAVQPAGVLLTPLWLSLVLGASGPSTLAARLGGARLAAVAGACRSSVGQAARPLSAGWATRRKARINVDRSGSRSCCSSTRRSATRSRSEKVWQSLSGCRAFRFGSRPRCCCCALRSGLTLAARWSCCRLRASQIALPALFCGSKKDARLGRSDGAAYLRRAAAAWRIVLLANRGLSPAPAGGWWLAGWAAGIVTWKRLPCSGSLSRP